MKLIVATGNKDKMAEFSRILEPLGFQLVSMAEAGVTEDIEETGATFMENARIKAEAVHRITGQAAIADDSGLNVDALSGRPGVYSARYGGADLPHSQKIVKLLGELADVPAEQRTARFTAAICCVLADGTHIEAEEHCEGTIGYQPVGDGGFGYDPIFMVGEKSFSQLTPQEKDTVSHRGNALRSLRQKLQQK